MEGSAAAIKYLVSLVQLDRWRESVLLCLGILVIKSISKELFGCFRNMISNTVS